MGIEKFRQLVDTLDIVQTIDELGARVYAKDRKLRFLYMNRACAADLAVENRLDPVRLSRYSDESFFAPECVGAWEREEKAILEGRHTLIDQEEEEIWLDGRQPTWAITTKVPLFDKSGSIIGLLGFTTDVTAAALEMKRLRIAVRCVHEGLWLRDLRRGTIWFSNRWKEILGYGPHEISEDPDEFWSRIHIQDRKAVQTAVEMHLDGRTPAYNCEFRLQTKDGSYKWIRSRGMRTEEDGRDVFAGSHTDITESKSFEDFARRAFDATPALIFVKDRQLRFTFVNRALIMAFGKASAKDILGHTDEELNPDQEQVARFRRDDEQVLKENKALDITRETLTYADGSKHVLATRKVPLVFPGSHDRHLLGVSTDITELENEKTLLSNLMDNVPDGVFFKNHKFQYERVNRPFLDYVGVSSPNDVCGKSDCQLMPAEIACVDLDTDQQIVKSKRPIQYELAIPREGYVEWRLVSKAPICDDDGNVVEIVGISKDITRLRSDTYLLKKALTVLLDAIEAIENTRNEQEACEAALFHMGELEFPSVMISFLRDIYGHRFVVGDSQYSTGRWKMIAENTVRDFDEREEDLDILPFVLQRRKSEFVKDSTTHARCDNSLSEAQGLRAQYVIPLATDSLLIGTLQIDMGELDGPPESCRLLDAIGTHLSLAIERHRRLRELYVKDAGLVSQAKVIAYNVGMAKTVHELNASVADFIHKLNAATRNPQLRANKAAMDFLKSTRKSVDKWVETLSANMRQVQDQERLANYSVGTILSETINSWLGKAEAINCKLIGKDDCPQELQVRVPLSEITETLAILINNAIEANARNVVVHTSIVLATEKMQPRHYVQFEVIDDGVGVPVQHEEDIFRFGFTTKGKYGHGMGLAIAAVLAVEMGGRLWLKSGGQGDADTVIAFQIPAVL